jgi:hypothetical protein
MGHSNFGARWIRTVQRCGTATLLAALSAGGHAQSGTEAKEEPKVLTLHVYENLIQIPVVVLSSGFEPIAPIPADRFSISIDSGPAFHTKHVRHEGDDPISLSVLIDVDGGQDDLLGKIGAVVAEFGRTSLEGRDRISIYVEDYCAVSRVAFDRPPGLPDLTSSIALAVERSIRASRAKAGQGCKPEDHLWDALLFVVAQSSTLTGRRAVLAITGGEDEHSRATWPQVRGLAIHSGVAIFGLQAAETASYRFSAPSKGHEDPFRELCELTGGLVFTATPYSLNRRLREFSALLRDRYIVEFPRPDNLSTGDHDFLVSIAGLDGFIRPAGISVPIADPKMVDPNTVKPDPSLAPQVGKRKVLPKSPQ